MWLRVTVPVQISTSQLRMSRLLIPTVLAATLAIAGPAGAAEPS